MSGLFSSLSLTGEALRNHSRAVELTGKNLANINNPAYARQRLDPVSPGHSSVLGGVSVVHARNALLDSQVGREAAIRAGLEAQHDFAAQTLAAFGESIDRLDDPQFLNDQAEGGDSIRHALNGFFNAFEEWSANPDDSARRLQVMSRAEALVDTFGRIDARLKEVGQDINQAVSTSVESFNHQLTELHALNRQIVLQEARSHQSATDLRDTRQRLIENLSEFSGLRVSEQPDGSVSVALSTSDGDERVVLDAAGPRELSFDPASGQFSTPGVEQSFVPASGQLNGLIASANNILGSAQSNLDALANAVAQSVNGTYYQGYQAANPGPPATAEVPEASFFAQPNPPGSGNPVTAASIALYQGGAAPASQPLSHLSLRSSTIQDGGNDIALALADLRSVTPGGLAGESLADFPLSMVQKLATETHHLNDSLSVQRDVESLLHSRRSSESGVSMDEEVARLVQFQHAFQATSRVFNTLSEMLDTVVNNLSS